MPKERPTKRKDRRKQLRENYLAGRASRPYRHTPTLEKSFSDEEHQRESEEAGTSTTAGPSTTASPSTMAGSSTTAGPGTTAGSSTTAGPSTSTTEPTSEKVCCKCAPVLGHYKIHFDKLVHQGSDLKRRKSRNPHPKRVNTQPYRDLNTQNTWLRSNIFDAMGNYVFCARCVCAVFHISPQRLSRLRQVQRSLFQQPTKEMTKSSVEERKLGAYVVMPQGCDVSFLRWWRSLSDEAAVVVRYPHERHGNAGKVSNAARTSVMEDFLAFVDNNSQPNGRSADSHGPTWYFISKFTTIQSPKKDVHNYDERLRRSVVGEFNKSQRGMGKGTCSNGSACNWLQEHRPKVAICPHKQDYCDTCAKHNTDIHTQQTTLNRIRQSGSASVEDQLSIEAEIKRLEDSLEEHRTRARLSHEHYIEQTKLCEESMKKIREANDEEERASLQRRFTLTLSVDYQMSKLVPHWGFSPQPGSTYYFQKLSHDILGIVNHSDKTSCIYIFDERTGPKNTDHTVSYITNYLCDSGIVPTWVRRLHLFLDNACSTNKNCYMLGWASEFVQQGRFDLIRISFLIAGHTKFAPDLLFSQVSQTFSRSDVFNTAELGGIARQYADVVIDEGDKVQPWREALMKYSTLPGIRELHDFVFARNPGCDVRLKVRPLCYTGCLKDSPFHVKRGYRLQESSFPTTCYKSGGLTRELSESKVNHLRQMYDNFISSDRRLLIV